MQAMAFRASRVAWRCRRRPSYGGIATHASALPGLKLVFGIRVRRRRPNSYDGIATSYRSRAPPSASSRRTVGDALIRMVGLQPFWKLEAFVDAAAVVGDALIRRWDCDDPCSSR